MKYNLSLYIFRRDLRIQDNTALNAALMLSEKVLPCFIFDERQIKRHEYFSENAFLFMVQSIKNLKAQFKKNKGRLFLFKGDPDDIITRLIQNHQIDAVFINKDYTPFSQKRDARIKQVCSKHQIDLVSLHDYLLSIPGKVMTQSGTPYRVFTPFWRNAHEQGVKEPDHLSRKNFFDGKISNTIDLQDIKVQDNPNLYVEGGRHNALKILDDLSRFKQYKQQRNIPELDSTTGLSAHHKFGTVSVREVFHRFKSVFGEHEVMRELYWRDFFIHLIYHYPELLDRELQKKVRGIHWDNDKELFKKWKKGKTGFPIVDAGMRELNTTGYMHNRVRMIVASFLTKDLHIDWRWGERYFAQKLVDYDPAVNNGNWQWAASVGADTKMRIFNPWLQQEKYDEDAQYIKKWVPELKNIVPATINKLYKENIDADYPDPIIDHSVERKIAWEYYRP